MSDTNSNEGGPSRVVRSDVARLAGVSTATVSYVLNGGPKKVSQATELRVREAAEELGYHPNLIARALKSGSAKMLGMIITDFSNPYFAQLINDVEQLANEREHVLILNTSHGSSELERRRIDELTDRGVDAIFVSSMLEDGEIGSLSTARCPIILLDRSYPLSGCKCVSTDMADAVVRSVRHLFEHGRRKVAMLFGLDITSRDARVVGWIKAHQDAGRPVGPVYTSSYSREGGYKATLKALRSSDRPDAIFASSDLEALGALRAIHECGLRIPEDIALISFDGTIESEYTWPRLTVMKQDTQTIARCAVNAALSPADMPDLQLVDAEMVIRQSCGCRDESSEVRP